jgi:phosphatidylglycerol:prolipoprotein diacylglycerol transferase
MQLSGIESLRLTFGYFVLNIDPILVKFGNLAVHWYGLMYVVAICVGLFTILRYSRRLGLHEDQVWGLFIWTAIGGLIGGRLYFVIQQPNLVSDYLLKPYNIIAVWNGGMAFFGAIFLGSLTLFALAPRYGVDRFIAIDGGAMFAAVGQIFGRFGNIVNGDILGHALTSGPVAIPANVCAHSFCVSYVSDPHILPWAFVYLNPSSFAPTGIPFQPAPVYEILLNLVALAILWPLRFRLPRIKAGFFFVLYAALYAVTQFIVFFARGTEPFTPFLGIDGLKQAQWTAVVVFLLTIPAFFLVNRFSRPWPYSEEHPVPLPGTPAKPVQAGISDRSGPGTAALQVGEKGSDGQSRSEEQAAPDLPPWQPTRATGGRLRNVFTPVAAPSSPDQQR